MWNFVDMSGWKMWEHGVPDSRIIVLKRAKDKIYENGRRVVKWECRCSCGSNKVILSTTRGLTNGNTKSCGCLHSERAREAKIIHGETDSRLYHIWCGIKARCLNSNNAKYKNYGGRGVTICREWKQSYESFRDWSLNNGYAENLSIDRIDVNGNYEPSNCRWADNFIQANNRTDNFIIEYNGEIHTIHEWAIITGISAINIRNRIKNLGWTTEKALNTLVKHKEVKHETNQI